MHLQWPQDQPNDLSGPAWSAKVHLRVALDDTDPYADASAYVTLSAGTDSVPGTPGQPNIDLLAPPVWTLALVDGHYEWAFVVVQDQTPDPPYEKCLLYGVATVVTRAAR